MRAKAPEKGSEFITISTEAHTPRGAALIANLIAQTYIKREEANHRRAVEKAIGIARRQVRRLEASAAPKVAPSAPGSKGKATGSSSPNPSSVLQATNLNTKINQLESTLGLA